MTARVAERLGGGTAALLFLPPLALVAALVAGGVVVQQPKLALGGMVAVCVFVLAWRAPVANLTILLFLTAVVPYTLQNTYGIGGGLNSPGLLPSDLFLLAGVGSAILQLPSLPLDRRRWLYLLGMTVFLLVVAFQFVHGIRLGHQRSIVGQEGRVLLGFGTFLMALPLLAHSRSRRRLLLSAAVLAFVLGAWGMLQWLGHFSYAGGAGDVGVRAGVAGTTNGVGQLQGGEFGFPVAIIVCSSCLIMGEIRSLPTRLLLLGAVALNAASCLVTFERSFWIDTLAGIAFVSLMAPGFKRVKAITAICTIGAVALVGLSIISPSTLTTAQQRLNSISGYGTDYSVRYRLVESGFVYQEVATHPTTGAGLGASIFWGQPWAKVPPKVQTFSHDGYLWLSWKLGIPAAALLTLLLVGTLFQTTARRETDLSRAVRRGAQGAILGLLIATITFPSYSQLSISAVMGLLIALAVSPEIRPRPLLRAVPSS
jgi:O-antigen ligase/polysaccharide polymerase Wzy-like membrane protein